MEISEKGNEAVPISCFSESNVPEELKVSSYFDFTSLTSDVAELFQGEGIRTVLDPLMHLERYLQKKLEDKGKRIFSMKEVDLPETTIVTGKVRIFAEGDVDFSPAVCTGPRKGEGFVFLGRDSVVTGAFLCTEKGHISIGEGSLLGPGSTITGPAFIGRGNEIRPGCYFREHVLTGAHGVFRCEAKHAVFLDGAQFPHPSYVGDSIMGSRSHFGNQVTTANITLSNASLNEEKWRTLVLPIGSVKVDTGLTKLGVIMGDYSQAGCGAVFNPGVFLRQSTWIYPLSLVETGFYGPSVIMKNKPAGAGVLSIAPLGKQIE